MAKNHGAKQQKKLAKQKAKRSEKRASLARRTSTDPTVRLQSAAKWPVVQALVAADTWEKGLGTVVIAREESERGLVFAVYLVDVYCLGVKNAFWQVGTHGEFRSLVERVERNEEMRPIDPGCLVKLVEGAVEYARSFGFAPHADYRHASLLLAGIDVATCSQEFTFGRDGKPFYVQGPNESPAEVRAIMERVHDAGGLFAAVRPGLGSEGLNALEDDYDDDSLE